MKSYYYSELFGRMISCDTLGTVYPCIGVKDVFGKDIMLGNTIEYTDPNPEVRTLHYDSYAKPVRGQIEYLACRYVLKLADGRTVDPSVQPASSMKIIGHIENII